MGGTEGRRKRGREGEGGREREGDIFCNPPLNVLSSLGKIS